MKYELNNIYNEDSYKAIKDIPVPEIPFPCNFESLRIPVLITEEYYDKLPESEKTLYEKRFQEEEIK